MSRYIACYRCLKKIFRLQYFSRKQWIRHSAITIYFYRERFHQKVCNVIFTKMYFKNTGRKNFLQKYF